MKNVETIQIENYTCDECKKSMTIPYIHLEIIDDNWMRLIENNKHNQSRNLTYWRKDIDLCSIDCWKAYLWKTMEELLYEVIRA